MLLEVDDSEAKHTRSDSYSYLCDLLFPQKTYAFKSISYLLLIPVKILSRVLCVPAGVIFRLCREGE